MSHCDSHGTCAFSWPRPPAPAAEMPWGVGARALWGLWAVGAMHMLKLFRICLAFMGQGFLVWQWCGSHVSSSSVPCGTMVLLRHLTVGSGCHSSASAWSDLTQCVGNWDRGTLLSEYVPAGDVGIVGSLVLLRCVAWAWCFRGMPCTVQCGPCAMKLGTALGWEVIFWGVAWGSWVFLGMPGMCGEGIPWAWKWRVGSALKASWAVIKDSKVALWDGRGSLYWGLLCWWDKAFLVESHALFEIPWAVGFHELSPHSILEEQCFVGTLHIAASIFFPWILLQYQCIWAKSVHLWLSSPTEFSGLWPRL